MLPIYNIHVGRVCLFDAHPHIQSKLRRRYFGDNTKHMLVLHRENPLQRNHSLLKKWVQPVTEDENLSHLGKKFLFWHSVSNRAALIIQRCFHFLLKKKEEEELKKKKKEPGYEGPSEEAEPLYTLLLGKEKYTGLNDAFIIACQVGLHFQSF